MCSVHLIQLSNIGRASCDCSQQYGVQWATELDNLERNMLESFRSVGRIYVTRVVRNVDHYGRATRSACTMPPLCALDSAFRNAHTHSSVNGLQMVWEGSAGVRLRCACSSTQPNSETHSYCPCVRTIIGMRLAFLFNYYRVSRRVVAVVVAPFGQPKPYGTRYGHTHTQTFCISQHIVRLVYGTFIVCAAIAHANMDARTNTQLSHVRTNTHTPNTTQLLVH